MNAKHSNDKRCEATTDEGKRCRLKWSAAIGNKHFCGNHANIARATQLRHSDVELAPSPVIQGRTAQRAAWLKPEAQHQQEVDAAKMLQTVRALEMVEAPDKVLVQMLAAWKAGDL